MGKARHRRSKEEVGRALGLGVWDSGFSFCLTAIDDGSESEELPKMTRDLQG